MNTYKSEDGYFLDVSGIVVDITPEEYTMLNNIKQRTLKKHDCSFNKIVGQIETVCELNNEIFNHCPKCPYRQYCDDMTVEFNRRYNKEIYDKIQELWRIRQIFNISVKHDEETILWSNTLEELIYYAEGEA